MQIFNSTTNVNTNSTRVNSKSKTRINNNVSSSKFDAVNIFIDPVTLRSEEYILIQRENNHYPIYNPNVLLYDKQLNLYTYEKF